MDSDLPSVVGCSDVGSSDVGSSDVGWDDVADVVVIGFGAAGVCAALEAVDAAADVLVLDRFAGGGATAISGGIVYAGGGTDEQRAAGVTDTPEDMYAYLSLETKGAVRDETLRRFVDESVSMIEWLKGHGVPFEGSLAPYKTSYPTNEHYLYYSGNELSGPARAVAKPAARGHRARGKGTSGKAFFAPLRAALERKGARIRPQTRADDLVLDDHGRVVGVICSTMAGAPAHARAQHAWLSKRVGKLNLWYRPVGKRLSARLVEIERRHLRRWTVEARRGVVVSAGGFAFNREMVRQLAAPYARGLPLGTLGDDGAGIRMGRGAGGATRRMSRMSAWRFYCPPSALAKGLLLGANGQRVCDESLYGAAVAEAVIHEYGGSAYLLVDRPLLDEARAQIPKQTLWFQRLQARSMLGTRIEAATLAGALGKAGIDVAVGERAVAAYNELASAGTEDPLGKQSELLQPLATPPYSIIDVSVRASMRVPCPTMSLGGLVVDEDTGQVLDEADAPIPGLYAAGRSAVGICSESYVSGLSLADCVFSGRRAGRAVGAAGVAPDVSTVPRLRC